MTDVPVPHSLTVELLAHMAQWPGGTVLADEVGNPVGPPTLDTCGHLWPDRDESTRAAVEAVFQDRADYARTAGDAP